MFVVRYLAIARTGGSEAKIAAWIIRRLITVFNRAAKRGHFPRERAMRRIYAIAGIPLPADPRHLISSCSYRIRDCVLLWVSYLPCEHLQFVQSHTVAAQGEQRDDRDEDDASTTDDSWPSQLQSFKVGCEFIL